MSACRVVRGIYFCGSGAPRARAGCSAAASRRPRRHHHQPGKRRVGISAGAGTLHPPKPERSHAIDHVLYRACRNRTASSVQLAKPGLLRTIRSRGIRMNTILFSVRARRVGIPKRSASMPCSTFPKRTRTTSTIPAAPATFRTGSVSRFARPEKTATRRQHRKTSFVSAPRRFCRRSAGRPYFETMASQAAVWRERDPATGLWNWYMYFSYRGKDGTLPGIRLATSRDGKAWTRQFNAQDPRGMGQIFVSTPDAYYEWHQISKIGRTYVLCMEVGTSRGKRWRPGIAVSDRPDRGWVQLDLDTVLQTKWEELYRDDALYHVATPALYQIAGSGFCMRKRVPCRVIKTTSMGSGTSGVLRAKSRFRLCQGLSDLHSRSPGSSETVAGDEFASRSPRTQNAVESHPGSTASRRGRYSTITSVTSVKWPKREKVRGGRAAPGMNRS